MPTIPNDHCLTRTAAKTEQPKTASGITVFLLEELGDARMRCVQLKQHLDEATKIIEKSGKRDHIFEVAGHLLHGIPDTLLKLSSALDTAALAAARLDYEEIKDDLRPTRVEDLERALKDVRVRRVHRGFEDGTMDTHTAAEMLDRIAAQVEATGKVPTNDVMHLVALLEKGQSRTASLPPAEKLAEHFRSLGGHLTAMAEKGTPPSRVKLAGHLRRLAGETMDNTSAQVAAEIYQQASSREDVMKGFKESNPSMSQADLESAADQWEKNKDVVKDKTADSEYIPAPLPGERQVMAHKKEAVDGARKVWDAIEAAWVRGDLANDPASDPHGTFARYHADLLQAIKSAIRTPVRNGRVPKGQLASLADAVVLFAYGLGMRSSNAAQKTARFEAGKPADPTKNMDQGDKKDWAESNDKHEFKKDKSAAGTILDDGPDRMIVQSLKRAYEAGVGNVDPENTQSELSGAYKELLESAKGAMRASGNPLGHIHNISSSVWELMYWMGSKKASAKTAANWQVEADVPDPVADQAMRSRFEEGKPADPTQHMDPEEAKDWKSNTDKYKDKFTEKEAGSQLTKMQLKRIMKQHNIPGELGGAGVRWTVELPNDAAEKLFSKHVKVPFGGYQSGHGSWVLKPDYKSKGDPNDPSSRHHYAAWKTAE